MSRGPEGVLRIGACQTPEILGDVEAAVDVVLQFSREAEDAGVDVLVFPECFLQGYLVDEGYLANWGMDLSSPEFARVLERLAAARPTLVFGIIERDRDRYLNTAVVVRRGAVVGAYRKTYLTAGEALFTPGDEYPVFEERGVRYGINICYDANFPDAAAAVAAAGADVLLLPAQNMMPRPNAEIWRDEHGRIRALRAVETGMWLVSADVTGERDAERVGWGPTSAIDPSGRVVAQVPLMTTGMVWVDVPAPAARSR